MQTEFSDAHCKKLRLCDPRIMLLGSPRAFFVSICFQICCCKFDGEGEGAEEEEEEGLGLQYSSICVISIRVAYKNHIVIVKVKIVV